MPIQAVWFAYPMTYWNKKIEKDLINSLRTKFHKCFVETANCKGHEKLYQRWKKDTGHGMDYYFKCVLPRMDIGTFMAFEDGMFGAGAYGEAEKLASQNKPIYEINLKFKLKELTLDTNRRLSIEETRERYKK